MKRHPGRFLVLAGVGLLACGPARTAWPQSDGGDPYAPQRLPATGARALSPTAGPSASADERAPFQLSPKQQKYINDILAYWEYRSSKVRTFQCKFTRWEYNPTFLRDPNVAWSIGEGVIRYAAPDKGMFKVEVVRQYVPPPRTPDGKPIPGGRPAYKTQPGTYGEHWICDGKEVFEFDYRQKRLIETELPEPMQGKAIADGPLPFLFGAKADKMKARYWVRAVKPPDLSDGRPRKGEYWLEVYPKFQQDAANYQRIEVILDEKDFLPKAMQLYLPGGRERKVFQFTDRKVNDIVQDLTKWLRKSFYKPQTPSGWKRVVHSAQQGPSPRTAIAPRGSGGR